MPVPIEVRCYAGSREDEEPRAMRIEGRQIEIMAIRRRWLEPGYRYFEVQAYDGEVCTLRREDRSGAWQLVSMRPLGS
jgi:hypothetical protein